MKVFSKAKYMKERGLKDYCPQWAAICDGKTVSECFPYVISDDWCVDIPDDARDTARKLVEKPLFDVEKLLKGIETQVLNCRCTVLKEAPPKHPRYKIVIECNDDFTTARMFVDGYPVKGEVAKRNPADKFNWRIGAQTAFNRLWEKKKKPVKGKDEPVMNERVAKPGEYVRISEHHLPTANIYTGQVLKIVHDPIGGVKTNHAYYGAMPCDYLYPFEYEVIDNYKPE